MRDILLALAVASLPSITAPLILIYLTNRSRRAEKRLDWEREDAVAARVAETARLAKETSEKADAHSTLVNDKLDVIHTLVNSNMTAAMQSEHDAVERDLASLREVAELHKAAGREPSTETLATIEATEAKLQELKVTLEERFKSTEKAETQVTVELKHTSQK